jgi:hypothetical protein
MPKPPAPPRTFTVADAHALADRLERNQRQQSDQAIAAKLIRALLAGRTAGDIIWTAGRVIAGWAPSAVVARGGSRCTTF